MHVHPPQTVAEPRPSDRRRPVRIRSCGTPDGGGSVRIGDAGLSAEAQEDACIQTATQTAPPRPDTAHSYPQRAGTTAVWAQGPFCGPAGHRASSTSPSPRIPVPARVQWVVRHLPGRPPRTAGHAPAARGDRDLRGAGGPQPAGAVPASAFGDRFVPCTKPRFFCPFVCPYPSAVTRIASTVRRSACAPQVLWGGGELTCIRCDSAFSGRHACNLPEKRSVRCILCKVAFDRTVQFQSIRLVTGSNIVHIP